MYIWYILHITDFSTMIVASTLTLCVCAADGESADDRHRSMGEVVRPGLQLPGGRRSHRCGGLPLLCGPGRPHWGHEASSGLALLRILYAAHATAPLALTWFLILAPRCQVFQLDQDSTRGFIVGYCIKKNWSLLFMTPAWTPLMGICSLDNHVSRLLSSWSDCW